MKRKEKLYKRYKTNYVSLFERDSYLIIIALFFAGFLSACKSSQKASAPPTTNLSGVQRADVSYLFFNANKEKILGNLNSAAELFADVIRKDGTNHAAMYELANIYVQQKKNRDALFFI